MKIVSNAIALDFAADHGASQKFPHPNGSREVTLTADDVPANIEASQNISRFDSCRSIAIPSGKGPSHGEFSDVVRGGDEAGVIPPAAAQTA